MNTKSLSVLAAAALLLPCVASADDADLATENAQTVEETVAKASSLKANLKRVALEYLNHSVTHKNDPAYPDSYSDDEETTIGGVFDGNLTYENTNMVWVNGLFMEYSKNKTTENGVTTKNEQNDEILLFTDYTHKVWQLEDGVVGPFAYLGYETEFTDFDLIDANNKKHSYRTKILRAKGGIKLYDGKYFKQLYIAVVEEDDMTYNNDNMKTGGEIGYEFNYPINPSTNFISEGYARKFFSYSKREATDFKYKVECNNRIETKLTGDLYLAPFYNYEIAETRGARSARSQSTIGLSLSYNKSFDIF